MGISYPVGDVNEVTIEAETPELLLSETVSNTNNTKDVHLVLTRGAAQRDKPEINRSELQKSDKHGGRVQIFETDNEAIAYILCSLETQG